MRLGRSWLVAAAVGLPLVGLVGSARGPEAGDPAAADLTVSRYELGRRLKAFEAEWETAAEAPRERTAAKLVDVHPQVLSLRLAEAGRTLDLATHALGSDSPPGPSSRWAASLYPAPETRLVDGAARELAVTVRPLYSVRDTMPKTLELQLWFNDKQVTTAKPDKFPFSVKVPLPALGEFRGLDRKLYFMVETGRVIRRSPVGVSQADQLAGRVAALKTAADGWTELDTIEKATVRDRAGLLAELAGGSVPETDLPAAGLLANAEAMLDGKPFFTPEKAGQFWMSVPLGGKKTAPVRVFVPRGLDAKKPVPVVVGLHGAGGSENVFFEAYGAGRAVAECGRRGWVFVATRSGLDFTGGPPVAEVLDQLGRRYPVDPKRVFLVGHSMGAMQAIALAQTHPGRFAAVAALGGGGRVTDPKALASLPVFVGAGEKDFGLGFARELNKTLTVGGATGVTYKEYPGADHLLIVREALPDVFAGFDKVAGR
ncbi:MAG: alpha/beta hydrolase [Gemmataceae bacterium]|nr:alpha/beta hydrolase [Gemmataceae bacterium]